MRVQPSQSRQNRADLFPARPAKGIEGRIGFASAVVLASPFSEVGTGVMQADPGSVFTAVFAVLAGILGLSASLLYRHMHQRNEELSRRASNAEAELRALLMMTDEAVLVLSPDGTVRAANPAAEEIFNRGVDEFVGEALTEVIAQPLALGELTRHGPVNFETTAKRGKDQFTQVEMLLSPVELTTGKGYLALVHRTGVATPAEALKQPKKETDIQGTVEKFTHDLNNQLTSVLGNLSLALMSQPGDPATHQRLLEAKKTAFRAQMLSHEMQSFFNPEADENPSTPETSKTPNKPKNPDMNCTILPMPKAKPERAPRSTRILILDDEEAICMLVSSVLDASGFEVSTATSVATALRLCTEALESGAPISLLICDLSLPGDTDGVEALRQLHAIDPNLRAIVSSGYDNDAVMRDCRKAGFCAAMSKPYDIAKLVRTVGEALAEEAAPVRRTA